MKTKVKKAPTVTQADLDAIEESLAKGPPKGLGSKLKDKVAKEIAKGPTFDDAEEREPEAKAESDGDLVGVRVSFRGLEGETLKGKVISQSGEEAVILGDDGDEWDAKVPDITILKDEVAEPAGLEDEDAAPSASTAPQVLAVASDSDGDVKDSGAEVALSEIRILRIDSIKVPKNKVRELDKESDEYKRVFRDIKQNGQEDPIWVSDFGKPVLVDGNTRLEILKDLGRKLVAARVKKVETENQRLYHGVRFNHQRNQMHWMDLARAFAKLVSDGEFKQAAIARDFDIQPSELSKMLAAIQLPEPVIKLAEQNAYPQSVITELALAPPEAKARVAELMQAGSDMTVLSVREIAREARKEQDEAREAAGEPARESKGHGGARNTKPKETRNRQPVAYTDLSVQEVGEAVRYRVYGNRVEIFFSISHEGQSFKGFDPVKAIKDVFNESYGNENLSVRSHEDLAKALADARAGLA